MLIQLVLLVVGMGLVAKGGDYFVDACVEIAIRTRLPRAVVGGTIVSLATTSPEVAVSMVAGLRGEAGLAVGNALGSVAANVGFILALVAILRPIRLSPGDFRWRSGLLLSLAVLLFLMTLDMSLSPWRGALLLAVAGSYLVFDYMRAGPRRVTVAEERPIAGTMSGGKLVWLFLLGVAAVVMGSRLLVNSGVAVASALGAPPMFIGLTLVAVGTSLPELVTAVIAVRKNVADLSVGNLLGASILNLTLVVGSAASISTLTLAAANRLYVFLPLLVILTVSFLAGRSGDSLSRREGVLLMTLYLSYVAGLAYLQIA